MQAHTRKVASHLILVTDPDEIQAAKDNNLYIENKPALIIRGIPAQDTIRAVYALFATKLDLTGSPFRLSHQEKGIMAKDQWNEYSKVTSRMFSQYLEHWCTLVDLTTYQNKPALVVVNKLSSMLVQLFHQSRFLTVEMLEPFTWVD
jgi:hypothetical protein